MPVMDGIRAAESLKQLMPQVPVLLFTVQYALGVRRGFASVSQSEPPVRGDARFPDSGIGALAQPV